jgi:hypothetical protein
MPAYITDPNTPRRTLLEGIPGYSVGSFALGQAPTRFFVTSVAVAANVVTLGVKIVEGNIPAVGNLITVRGTVAGGSAVNVTNVALSAVSINAATGIGTVSYSATTGNLSTTPDGGQAVVPVQEIPETLSGAAKYQQLGVPFANPELVTGRVVTWAYKCPTNPATIALQLEGAIDDIDAEYAIIGASQTNVAGATIIGNVPIGTRFLRTNVTANTGGGSLISKFLI